MANFRLYSLSSIICFVLDRICLSSQSLESLRWFAQFQNFFFILFSLINIVINLREFFFFGMKMWLIAKPKSVIQANEKKTTNVEKISSKKKVH